MRIKESFGSIDLRKPPLGQCLGDQRVTAHSCFKLGRYLDVRRFEPFLHARVQGGPEGRACGLCYLAALVAGSTR